MQLPEIEFARQAADAGPFVWSNLVPTLWMVAVGAFGGVVSFIQKVKAGKARAFNIPEFIGEILISAFSGLITFWICQAFGVNQYLTAAGVAICGHMGTRAIFLIEQWGEEKIKGLAK